MCIRDRHYITVPFIPAEILLPLELSDKEALASSLSELKGRRVQLLAPQRGEKAQLLNFANENARQNLVRHTLLGGGGATQITETLKRLAELVDQPQGLDRIEAYDCLLYTSRSGRRRPCLLDRVGRYRRRRVAGTDDPREDRAVYRK